jgi:hypothetical protein
MALTKRRPIATKTSPSPPTVANLIGFLIMSETASAAALKKLLPVMLVFMNHNPYIDVSVLVDELNTLLKAPETALKGCHNVSHDSVLLP